MNQLQAVALNEGLRCKKLLCAGPTLHRWGKSLGWSDLRSGGKPVWDDLSRKEGRTRSGCGGYGCGVAFKLTLEGREKVLYSFCAQSGCPDGTQPYAGVVFDWKGNLYGTAGGGAHLDCGGYPPAGCGVVLKINPEGKETVLYSFCAQTNCTDGAGPYGGLIVDRLGNLYGTA